MADFLGHLKGARDEVAIVRLDSPQGVDLITRRPN